MKEGILQHHNPARLGLNSLLKRDLKLIVTIILIFGFGTIINTNLGEPSLFWITVLTVYQFVKWLRAKSMKFAFYQDHFLANNEAIPYDTIVRILKNENMMSVEVRRRFITKTYLFHNPDELLIELLRTKFQPRPVPERISKIIRISKYMIYLTVGFAFLFFYGFMTNIKVTPILAIAFAFSSMSLIIASNVFFLLHIRYDERSEI